MRAPHEYNSNLLWKLLVPVVVSATITSSNDDHTLPLVSSSSSSTISLLQNDYYILRHGQSLANVAKMIVSNPTIATLQYGLSDLGKEQVNRAVTMIIQQWHSNNNPIDPSSSNNPNMVNPIPNNEQQQLEQQQSSPYTGLRIISSDLLRAKETAMIVHEGIQRYNNRNQHSDGFIIPIVNDNRIKYDIRLRERWFGQYDMTSDENYLNVWKEDAINSSHTINDVESVDDVMRRVTELIVEMETTTSRQRQRQQQQSSSSSTQQPPPSPVHREMIVLVAHGDVLQILQTAFLLNVSGRHHRTAVLHLDTATLRGPLLLSMTASKPT
jgi:broad specificity phosphatase PhoE